MKASKMTNEMLAKNLEATIPFLMEEARHLTDADEIMTEAAARLRKSTLIEAALNINVGMNNAAAMITADLRAKLKVAEDALEKLQTICRQTEYVYGRVICDDALAAIREEGCAK